MPSLPSIQKVEDTIGLPVVSAAVCTTHQMLTELGLEARVPGAGALLSDAIEGMRIRAIAEIKQ